MTSSAFFLGLPQEFEKNIMIYPPTINQIVGDNSFWKYVQILTTSQEEIEDIFAKNNEDFSKLPDPFSFLLANCYSDKGFEELTLRGLKIFTKEPAQIIYEQKLILIGDIEAQLQNAKTLEDFTYLSEDNFFKFQNMIRESLGEKPIEPPREDEDPRVKRIKAKARYRDRIKAKKGLGLNSDSLLSSICCMGLGITPLNIGEITYVAAQTMLRRFQEREKYETDVRSLQSGFGSKKIKPKYWIRNITD